MEDLFGENTNVSIMAEKAMEMAVQYAPKLLLALVTLIVGLWLINRLVALLNGKLKSKDPTLAGFLCGLISVTLKVLLLISVASMVGIATTSFVALVGAAGLAVGLALQGSLANFAGGVLILIFKPFKVGDTIEAQGFLGAVADIQILYTILNTFDNRRIIIPNGSLSNATLVNVGIYETRRCDMSFRVHYGDDLDKAKAILKRLVEEDDRTLPEPEPRIAVGALSENSVDILVRPWLKGADYWPYYWDMQEKVKKAFEQEGFSVPVPRRNIFLHQEQQQ